MCLKKVTCKMFSASVSNMQMSVDWFKHTNKLIATINIQYGNFLFLCSMQHQREIDISSSSQAFYKIATTKKLKISNGNTCCVIFCSVQLQSVTYKDTRKETSSHAVLLQRITPWIFSWCYFQNYHRQEIFFNVY